MNTYEIIEKKKLGQVLTEDEIKFFVNGYTKGDIPDYQASALLMAIYFKGLNIDETYILTKAIIDSGKTIDLSKIEGIKVDKHSTGGVGDTTSLILGPLVASCGVPFAKMSGRGLGHTGGTLDKLESIPNMNINLTIDEFIKNTNEIKMALAGQTENVTPADKKLYALRDATATVDNLSLISSSIMSKKIAVGSDSLILDVKVGSGAFMKNLDDARALSKMMVEIGHKFNRQTIAIITNMDEPLGKNIGNSLEVIEAIDTLNGNGPKDLTDLCLELGAKLLYLAKKVETEEEGINILKEKIKNKEALNKFKEFVEKQGGDSSYIDDPSKFKLSPIVKEVYSDSDGYIKKIDALLIGEAAKNLGAGREKKEDEIDLGAGIVLNKKIDDYVKKGDLLATLYTQRENEVQRAVCDIKNAYIIGDKNKMPYKIIIEEIR